MASPLARRSGVTLSGRSRRARAVRSLLLISCVAAPVVAQCTKPPVPRGGLGTETFVDLSVRYSDGYRTLGDLVLPAGSTSCRWPLVVYAHQWASTRKEGHAQRLELARAGFAVWSYDIRGQSDAYRLNPKTVGSTLHGMAERFDLAEQIAYVTNHYGARVDTSRVAVIGASQGAIHAWGAAAWSGRWLSAAGRGWIRFPDIACVSAQHYGAEPNEVRLPGEGTIERVLVDFVSDTPYPGVAFDPAVRNQVRTAFLSQDTTRLKTLWVNEPGRDVISGLAQSRVPVFYSHAWTDDLADPGVGMAGLRTMPSTTPWRVLLATGGHGSPDNRFASELRSQLEMRWLDRFLWNVRNGVELEPRVVTAALPLDATTRNAAGSLWHVQHAESWPPTDTKLSRLWTDGQRQLRATAPLALTDHTLRHVVNPLMTPALFLSASFWRTRTAVLTSMPMSEVRFRAAATTRESELVGVPRVSLDLEPNAGRFHLAAALVAKAPNGQETQLSFGMWSTQSGTTSRHRVEIPMGPAHALLPIGTVIELRLRNHMMRDLPTSTGVLYTPSFQSFDVKVHHGDQRSFIELPLRTPRPCLVSATTSMPVTAPAPLSLEIRAPGRGGRSYLIFAGLSGRSSGTPFPGGTLPIRIDAFTDLVLPLSGTAVAPGFAGTLTANGTASASLRLDALRVISPLLLGRRLSVAGWVFENVHGFGYPTNPHDVLWR